MKQAIALMMRRFWQGLLVLAVAVLFVGQAHAHPGHAGRAEQRIAAAAAPPAAQLHISATHGIVLQSTTATMVPGMPCCPTGAGGGKCCTGIGCTVTSATLPMSSIPIFLGAPRPAALAPPPRDSVDGIRGTPPLPPPRFFAGDVIG